MTKRECAIVTAYTGVAMLHGADLECFYDYCSELLGFRAYTHELWRYADKIKEMSRKDFIELCRSAE